MASLSLPSTDNPALHNKVETRPKAVAEWLARLPFARPADAAQQLTITLYTLNRIALDEDARRALLTLYRPVVARAAASLEALLLDAGVPPLPQQRQAGTLLRELQVEYSIGCKHLVHALGERRFGRSQIRHDAEVTAQFLAALHAIQFSCHLTYTPMPGGLWLDMHQTYRLAKANGMADRTLNDTGSADQAYLQALLMELADPPHMSRAELAHLRLYLGAFGPLAQLATHFPDAALHGFAIDTRHDRGPGTAAVPPNPHRLWLDTGTLCRHAHETAIRLRTGETPHRIGLPDGMESELSLTLTKRLYKLWRPGAQRAFKRYPGPGEGVDIVSGVSAIHHLLEHTPQTPFAAPAAVNASRWTLNNDSASGLALSSMPDTPLNLKVGDALALRTGESARWSLAVIRWLKMPDARRVELGVERLAPAIEPVWVRPLKGRRKASSEPGLFVPGIPALGQAARLLLPSHLYQAGMEAEVRHRHRQEQVALGRRAEFSASFDLISFTVLSKGPLP